MAKRRLTRHERLIAGVDAAGLAVFTVPAVRDRNLEKNDLS